jgi:4-amino-4-deoxy-L-arabinose transferase-like glycosyltransferase
LEPIANPDGIEYTEIGISLVSGKGPFNEFGEYLFYRDKPVYPILIGLANLFLRDHTSAGPFVSMVFGSLSVFIVFLFAKNIYNAKIGYLAAFITIWYPYLSNNSSKVYNSATYVFFLLLAAYSGWIAYRENKTRGYLSCGFFTGLTYLTRFEVVEYFFLYVVFLFLRPGTRNTKDILGMVIVFAMTISSFHLYNFAHTGSPLFWAKLESGLKHHMGDVSLKPTDPPYDFFLRDKGAYVKHYIWGVGTMYSKYLPNIFPPLLIGILTIGLVEYFRRNVLSFNELFLLSLVFIPLVSIPILRPSGRNLIDYLPFLIILLSNGIYEVQRIVRERLEGCGYQIKENVVLGVITLAIFMTVFPHTLRPLILGPDEKSPNELMEMGQWIRRNLPPQEFIMTTGAQTAFYANSKFLEFLFEYQALLKKAKENGIKYVVLGNHNGPNAVEMFLLLREIESKSDLRLIHEVRANSGWAKLYRVE